MLKQVKKQYTKISILGHDLNLYIKLDGKKILHWGCRCTPVLTSLKSARVLQLMAPSSYNWKHFFFYFSGT